jgi:CRP-like cAMP-binding protein
MTKNAELYGSVYEKGEIVFRQGDPGETMFIIQYGAVEVSRIQNGHESVLAILEKGSFFGEMALIDNQPRSATVKTLCRSRLLALSKESLLQRIQKDPDVAQYLLKILIQRIERTNRLFYEERDKFFASHANTMPINGISADKDASSEGNEVDENHLEKEIMHRIMNLVSTYELKTFRPGQIIFRMGDSCDAMHIISEGLVEISQEGENATYVIAHLNRNDVFGEMCLIKDSPRNATATAKETTRTVCIKRDIFMTSLLRTPELAFFILQIMIIRLRRSMRFLHQPSDHFQSEPSPSKPVIKKKDALTMNLASLSACSGCMVGLLQEEAHLTELLERAGILYSPLLMDRDEMDFADIAAVYGQTKKRKNCSIFVENAVFLSHGVRVRHSAGCRSWRIISK